MDKNYTEINSTTWDCWSEDQCDYYEDRDRENGAEIRKYAPQYMATKAVKPCD